MPTAFQWTTTTQLKFSQKVSQSEIQADILRVLKVFNEPLAESNTERRVKTPASISKHYCFILLLNSKFPIPGKTFWTSDQIQ